NPHHQHLRPHWLVSLEPRTAAHERDGPFTRASPEDRDGAGHQLPGRRWRRRQRAPHRRRRPARRGLHPSLEDGDHRAVARTGGPSAGGGGMIRTADAAALENLMATLPGLVADDLEPEEWLDGLFN